MIHSGSRGLGHQVATDALVEMEKAMSRDNIGTNDRQLACARIDSTEGQAYLGAMASAANYAWGAWLWFFYTMIGEGKIRVGTRRCEFVVSLPLEAESLVDDILGAASLRQAAGVDTG